MNRQSATTAAMMRHLGPPHPQLDSAYRLVLVLSCLAAVGGCHTRQDEQIPGVKQLSEATRDLFTLEPTLTVERNLSIAEAAQAFEDQVRQIDIEGANEAIDAIKALTAELRSQAACLPDNIGEMLSDKWDEARLADLSSQLQSLIDETSTKVGHIDVVGINQAVTEVRAFLAPLSEKLEAIDIGAGNTLLSDVSSLKPDVQKAIEEATALIEKLQAKVDSLPVAQITQGVTQMNATTADLRRLFDYLRVTLCIAIAVLLLLGYFIIARLRRGN